MFFKEKVSSSFCDLLALCEVPSSSCHIWSPKSRKGVSQHSPFWTISNPWVMPIIFHNISEKNKILYSNLFNQQINNKYYWNNFDMINKIIQEKYHLHQLMGIEWGRDLGPLRWWLTMALFWTTYNTSFILVADLFFECWSRHFEF